MNWWNLNTKEMYVSGSIGGHINPTADANVMLEHGWRMSEELPAVSDGHERTIDSVTQSEENEFMCVVAYTDTRIADRLAAEFSAKVAAIPAELWQQAAVFRLTLRRHFGDNAETNHAVTLQSVTQYFIQKQVAGTITAQELADAVTLKELFAVISAWTGDGTSWGFPWQLLP